MPYEWKYGIIGQTRGKGDDMLMYDNYGAVTLLCTTYKILANILYVKLVLCAMEIIGEYQGVF